MPIESAEDRAIFLNPEEFGEAATVFPGTPDSRRIDVIFEATWIAVDPETGVEVSSTSPRIFANADDLDGVEQGDRIEVGGRVWRFADLQPDGTGMTTGVLTK